MRALTANVGPSPCACRTPHTRTVCDDLRRSGSDCAGACRGERPVRWPTSCSFVDVLGGANMQPVQITYHGLEASPALTELIQTRAQQLERVSDRIHSVRVLVDAPH